MTDPKDEPTALRIASVGDAPEGPDADADGGRHSTIYFGGAPDPSKIPRTRSRSRNRTMVATRDHRWQANPDDTPPPRAATEELLVGELVPGTRYQVVRPIGEGGMGIVYEAVHVDIERKVALKVLRRGLSPAIIRQFREEARAASRVGSEHIADVHDFATLPDGRLMFAMELLDGPILGDELELGPLVLPRTIAILRQCCAALAAAHQAGIVHRDIKPDNIALVRRRGRDDTVKLLDFGISTMVSAAGVADDTLKAGSPHYLAPEIISGLPYDARVDIYALGCVAFHLLTGRPPFVGKKVEDLLEAQLAEQPLPPSQARPGSYIPPALDAIVLRCVEKDPQERFANMNELHAALCEAQIEAEVVTAWDDLPVPDVEPDRRARILNGYQRLGGLTTTGGRRGLFWGIAGATLVLGLAAVLAFVLWARPEHAQGSAEPTPVTDAIDGARAAAARTFYVYPPADDPELVTAFGHVLRLESMKGPHAADAKEAAQMLRREFAEALVRTADSYWAAPGGKPFAVEYYKQALAFDPGHAVAEERAVLTKDELDELRRKTEAAEFEASDLVVVADVPEVTQLQEPVARTSIASAPKTSDRASKPRNASRKSRHGEPSPKTESKKTRGPEADELISKAVAARKSGNLDEAVRLYQKALGQQPRSRSALAALSDIEFDRGHYAEAAKYAERLVSASPGTGAHRIRLGDAYLKLGRYADAKKHYERAAKLGHSGAAFRLEKVNAKLAG